MYRFDFELSGTQINRLFVARLWSFVDARVAERGGTLAGGFALVGRRTLRQRLVAAWMEFVR